MLKKAIHGLASTAGYDIVRVDGKPLVRPRNFEDLLRNFENLSKAYEQLLNESNPSASVGENEVRPKLLARLLGTPPSEAYFIVQALFRTRAIDGDVCEFGVAQGETSALIANEIAGSNKMLHLFDSFQGLPRPSEKDGLIDDIFSLGSIEAYTGTMSCSEDMVIDRLEAISFPRSRYSIHKGFVEELIRSDKNLPSQVSFAYVDFDFYEPIKTALGFLHSGTPEGAIIIVDDYDFFSTGVKAAVDEFVRERNSATISYDIFVPNVRFGRLAILVKSG